MPNSKSSSLGFSIIELLVSISIIAIAFGVVLNATNQLRLNSRNAQRQSDLRAIQSALQQYYADQSFFPDDKSSNPLNLSTSQSLTSATGNPNPPSSAKVYTNRIPKDPSNTNYVYKAYISSSTLSDECDNGSSDLAKRCSYYLMCAKLENTSTGSCDIGGSTASYNFQVSPL